MDNYGKLCTQFYDIDKPGPPADAYPVYERYAAAARGPILEAMCGSGRFLVPLVQAGYDVDGIDASPDMLAACRRKCREAGVEPYLAEQRLEHLQAPRRYRLAFVCSGSFSLIIDLGAVRESLRRLFDALEPGGTLVVEIALARHAESFSWPWSLGKSVTRPDGARIVLSSAGRYDALDNVSYSVGRYELVSNAVLTETEFQEFNLRSYGLSEFAGLLGGAGFEKVRAMKPFTGEPAAEDDEAALFECCRPAS